MPTAVVVAGAGKRETLAVQRAFATDRLRVYSSTDVTPASSSGAPSRTSWRSRPGRSTALGFGHNARAGMITRGLVEMGPGRGEDGREPAHPPRGPHRRPDSDVHRRLSRATARSGTSWARAPRTLDDILATLGHVAEGVWSAPAVLARGTALGVEMPITARGVRGPRQQR